MATPRASTRTFTVPAGTTVNGFTLPATITETLSYSPSEMTASQAQKEARRRAAARIEREYGVRAPVTKLQRATATVQKATGRARGGRVPDRLKVHGFRKIDAGKGITIYRRGSERGRAIADGYASMDAAVRDILAAPGVRTVQVAAFGFPHEQSTVLQSPRRRKRDHPRGAWKQGDVVPHARQWGSTTQVGDVQSWDDIAGTPERFAFGASGQPGPGGKHTGTELDAERLSRIDIVVRERQ